MKYGFLTNLNIEISYLSLQLKLLEIEDLIIVLEPNASAASEIETVLSKERTFDIMSHLMKNYKALRGGKDMQENEFLEDFEKKFLEQRKKFIHGDPNQKKEGEDGEDGDKEPDHPLKHMPTKKNIREQTKKEQQKKDGEEPAPPNVMGPELYELVFGRLDFKIRINNVKIYYENDHSQKSQFGNKVEFQKTFSIMFNLKGLSLLSVCPHIFKPSSKTFGTSSTPRRANSRTSSTWIK